MILYPAVDILDGQAVRLVQGDFAAPTVYGDDPLDAALAWVEAGAPRNLDAVRRICAEARVPVQVGGGLRAAADVDAALEAGAARVVVGTAAYVDSPMLADVLARHGERIAVAVDVRNGRVSAAGWTRDTGLEPLAAIAELQERGVRALVYTNVDRDGMLEGPDPAEARRVAEAVDGALVWSGGIGELAHLEALARLPLAGVIVGKALYEGRFTVAEAHAALA